MKTVSMLEEPDVAHANSHLHLYLSSSSSINGTVDVKSRELTAQPTKDKRGESTRKVLVLPRMVSLKRPTDYHHLHSSNYIHPNHVAHF